MDMGAARVRREQAEIDRRSAESVRDLHHQPAEPGGLPERARELRKRIATAAAALARAEEEIARAHDEQAARAASGAGEYRRVAGQAREVERMFRD
jgi:hypothetical protein